MTPFSPNMPGPAALLGLCRALVCSPSSLCSHPSTGTSPTPAHGARCLRGQNKTSPKTACERVPNPQPRLHEVSNCGPSDRAWCFRLLVTLQFVFSTDVREQVSDRSDLTGRSWGQGSPALLRIPIHPVLCPTPEPVRFLSSPSLLSRSMSDLLPLLTLRLIGAGVINSFIKAIKKDGGRMRELTFSSTMLQTIRKRILNSCLRIVLVLPEYRPLPYLKICTCLAFRFGKFKFRFPSSLRNGSILWNIKVHTNHLDIKEWEVWSIFISVSLWLFLFVVFSAYSPQTKEKRRTGSQPAKWPARLPTLCFLGGRRGGRERSKQNWKKLSQFRTETIISHGLMLIWI